MSQIPRSTPLANGIRFVWTPRAFAYLAAAETFVAVHEGMPHDRIIMETLEVEGCEPHLAIVAHPYALRKAYNEAFKHWGFPCGGSSRSAHEHAARGFPSSQGLVVPIAKLVPTVGWQSNMPENVFPYHRWKIDL